MPLQIIDYMAKLTSFFRSKPAEDGLQDSQHGNVSPVDEHERKTSIEVGNTALNTGDSDDDSINIQDGLKRQQATTIVWSRGSLIAAYVLFVLPMFNEE